MFFSLILFDLIRYILSVFISWFIKIHIRTHSTHLIYVKIIRYSNDLFPNEYALICIFFLHSFVAIQPSSVNNSLRIEWMNKKLRFSFSFSTNSQERTVSNGMPYVFDSFKWLRFFRLLSTQYKSIWCDERDQFSFAYEQLAWKFDWYRERIHIESNKADM